MLGSADDLTAVLSVLDRLSKELDSNRQALDSSLHLTDDIGTDMPLGLMNPEKQADLARKVRQEMQNCKALQESIDDNMKVTMKAAQLARQITDIDNARATDIHKTAGHELISWQAQVEQLADECAGLAAAEATIDSKLAELYTKVRTADAKLAVEYRRIDAHSR